MMMWLTAPVPVFTTTSATLALAFLAAANARWMRARAQSAARSRNPAAIDATERRVSRSWNRHCTYVLPLIITGMVLLLAQAVAAFSQAIFS